MSEPTEREINAGLKQLLNLLEQRYIPMAVEKAPWGTGNAVRLMMRELLTDAELKYMASEVLWSAHHARKLQENG